MAAEEVGVILIMSTAMEAGVVGAEETLTATILAVAAEEVAVEETLTANIQAVAVAAAAALHQKK